MASLSSSSASSSASASAELRQRHQRLHHQPTDNTSSSQLVDVPFSRTDISKPYGRLALRPSRKHFIREMLAALQDGATDFPRIHIQTQLCFALLVIVCSLGVLFLARGASREETCINQFGDQDRPCPHHQHQHHHHHHRLQGQCYQRVDVHDRVIYTRDSDGYHFEMNPTCSSLAPEDDTMKCRGEWSFAREDEMVWYLRRYLNVTSGTTSLVSLPSLKDHGARLVAMRWIPRPEDPNRATWVFSSSLIPRDEFPDVDVVVDGTLVVGQIVVDNK